MELNELFFSYELFLSYECSWFLALSVSST